MTSASRRQCFFMPCPTKSVVSMTRVEKLRDRVREALCSVINLHIDILAMEANVSQLITEVKEMNADLLEANRLDALIQLLRDDDCGPVECHEWPYPTLNNTTIIDNADIAHLVPSPRT